MVLASLMLHSILEYKIAYLLHPLKMKSMFWLRQISSAAQDGDVESFPGKSLSEIPPAAVYFHVYTHTHVELRFSSFIFYNMMRLVRLVGKKKKSSDIHSPKSLTPRSLPRRTLKPEYTTLFGDLTNQSGFSSELNRWRSSLSGELPGLLPRCVSPLSK